MKNEVFITATASFFPNNPIDNNSIEDYLGLISGQHSRVGANTIQIISIGEAKLMMGSFQVEKKAVISLIKQ